MLATAPRVGFLFKRPGKTPLVTQYFCFHLFKMTQLGYFLEIQPVIVTSIVTSDLTAVEQLVPAVFCSLSPGGSGILNKVSLPSHSILKENS